VKRANDIFGKSKESVKGISTANNVKRGVYEAIYFEAIYSRIL